MEQFIEPYKIYLKKKLAQNEQNYAIWSVADIYMARK